MKNSEYSVRLMTIVITLSLLLVGCGDTKYPDMSDDAIAFEMGEYIDESDDDAAYGTIEYEGRIYMPYGILGGNIDKKDIDKCVGYIVKDENSSSMIDENDMDTRVYTLAGDPDHNYLMDYYIGSDLMNQPYFWRAVDTKGKEIDVPKYIDSLEYAYWEN